MVRFRGIVAGGLGCAVLAWGAGAAVPETPAPAIANPSPKTELSTAEELRNLRDPFKMLRVDVLENRSRSEIENVALDEIKVVGILTGPTRTRALVRAGGKTYVVGEGMRIGTDGAIIQRINNNGLVVSGTRVNIVGDPEMLTTEIPLAPENKRGESRANTSVTETSAPPAPPAPAAGADAPTSASAPPSLAQTLQTLQSLPAANAAHNAALDAAAGIPAPAAPVANPASPPVTR